MNEWPEAAAVERFLLRARQRMILLRAAEGLAAGLGVAAVSILAGLRSIAMLSAAILLPTILRVVLGDQWRAGWWRSLPDIADRIERRTSQGRNLIRTASELLERGRSYVHDTVMTRGSRLVTELDLAQLLPARKALVALGVAALVLSGSLLRPEAARRVVEVIPFPAPRPAIRRIEVTVTPPAYSGIAPSTTVNPSRIEALAASRIDVRIEATAESVTLETLGGTQAMPEADGRYAATISAESDGFLALEPRDSSGVGGARQLIGLTVTPDRPPRVTLTSPGRDLFFSAVPDAIPVAITADDDLALASVRLHYTAVSGTGERFTFVERDVPVTVSVSSPRLWQARGSWQLNGLGLSPGDLVVYRAVATDRRPGARPVESESYVIEVVTPGAIAAEGFAADDQRDRYAVSQQMVILKTERLNARRASLDVDSLSEATRLLAAEQRSVRAEFVFMMGGELEDIAGDAAGTLEVNEVAEAEAEGDLLAGRQQNQGRVDMMRAIRFMSRASTALTDANLDLALQHERAALENLMRAFARSRFILRALTQRERIDLDRRLSGALNLTAGLSGPLAAPVPDERTAALRRLLADVAAMAGSDSAAQRATSAALALLRADPASDTLQRLASRVQEVAADVRARSSASVAARVDSLLAQVSSLVMASLPGAPARGANVDAGILDGALRDALRRSGRER